MKMDTLYIQDLKARGCIGVFDWERGIQQALVLNLELDYDSRPAAASDDLAKAIDYGRLCERVLAHIEHCAFELIEALAASIAELILSEFAVHRVLVDLRKPGALRAAQTVGIRIERFKV